MRRAFDDVERLFWILASVFGLAASCVIIWAIVRLVVRFT